MDWYVTSASLESSYVAQIKARSESFMQIQGYAGLSLAYKPQLKPI